VIPDPLDKPAMQATVLQELAEGLTQADVSRIHEISPATVQRFAAANVDEIEERRRAIRLAVFEEAEQGSDGFRAATRVRLKDACTLESRTGPMSYRNVAEVLGMIGNGNLTVIGDVNVDQSTVSVDARSVSITAGDPQQLAGELARIRGTLGIG
jgi:hypothetical protein